MNSLAEWVLRRRAVLLVIFGLITAALGVGLLKVGINSDVVSYLPQDDPEVRTFNLIGEKFKGNYLAMVALERDDLFTYEALKRVEQLTRAYEQIEGVHSVTSLTNILDIRKTEWGIEVADLLPQIPRDPEELEGLKRYVLSKEMYRGVLVSEDGHSTLIVCRLLQDADRERVARQIRKITEELKEPGEKIYYAGMPLQMTFVNDMIMRDMAWLIPLVALILVIILFLGFRRARGVILPLGTVVLALVWSVGLMGHLGVRLTIISGIMPVVLLAVGSAYGIHMLNRYFEEVREEETKVEGIKRAVREVGLPIAMAGITTLVGFLSLLSSSLTLNREFAAFTALGVFFALLLAIVFIPAILSYLKVKPRGAPETLPEGRGGSPLLGRLARLILGHRRRVVLAFALVGLGCLVALPRISREVNMVEYFKEDNPVRVAEEMMRDRFGGSIPVQVWVKGDLKHPALLKELSLLELRMKNLEDVHFPQSIADLIAEMNDALNGRKIVPDTREKVANLWVLLEGRDIMGQLVTGDDREALIQARLGQIDTEHIIRLVGEMDSLVALIPRQVSVLELSRIEDPELKEKALRAKAQRAAEVIALQTHLKGQDVDEAKIVPIVLDHLAHHSSPYPLTLRERLREYFTGGEADVELEEEEAHKTAKVLWESLFRGYPPERAIRRSLPPHLLREDPEGVELVVEVVGKMIEEEVRVARVEKSLEALRPYLPRELLQNGEYEKKVRGALFEAFEGVAFLPSEAIDLSGDNQEVEIEMRFVGMPKIYKRLDQELLHSFYQSFILALVVVFGLMALEFKSPLAGFLSTLPIIFTILVNFGLMGLFRIPLDHATMMISSIAIGIGIDYSIHVLSRFKREYRMGHGVEGALERTLESTGRAVVLNAVSVAVGFLILILSSIVPLQRFGVLIAVTMFTSCLGALLLLPALILCLKAKLVEA